MKNNKGISYIEMILVIAIASILVGLVSVTIGLVNRNNVTKAIDRLQSGFSRAKILSMSKNAVDGSITIIPTKKGLCYYFGQDTDNLYKIANSPCTLWLVYDDGTSIGTTESSNAKTTFYFKHDTGAFDKAVTRTLDDAYSMNESLQDVTISIRNDKGNEANLRLLYYSGNTEIQ